VVVEEVVVVEEEVRDPERIEGVSEERGRRRRDRCRRRKWLERGTASLRSRTTG
jgi:hypothetical protein